MTSNGASITQTKHYYLTFKPENGIFWLFESDGLGHPILNPPPSKRELVVTEDNTEIIITALDDLTFHHNGPVEWLPINSIPNPGSQATQSPPNHQVRFTVKKAPEGSDVFGFWINMNYKETDPSLAVINLTTPFFFITNGSAQSPSEVTLSYDTDFGRFTYGNRINSIDMQKLQIFYRLSYQPLYPNSSIRVTLTSGPDKTAVFATPALRWSDGSTLPPDNPTQVTIGCPFKGGSAVGMRFAVKYKDTVIYSPDPIIMDKQIGDNGQP